MNEIKNIEFKELKNNRMLISFEARGNNGKLRNVKMSFEELLEMLDCDGTHNIGLKKNFSFKPFLYRNIGVSKVDDFPYLVAKSLQAALKLGVIDFNKYIDYLAEHYESFYMKLYKNQKRMVEDFCFRFGKYDNTFEAISKRYAKCFEECCEHKTVEVGGEVYGFWYDKNLEKTRPLTSRKTIETVVPDSHKAFVGIVNDNAIYYNIINPEVNSL